jgi:hypothetical protein
MGGDWCPEDPTVYVYVEEEKYDPSVSLIFL